MNKTEFALELYEKLPILPSEEIDERLTFYLEMIDDRMEDGLSEEDAVSAIGSIDDVAEQILADIPLSTIVKKSIKSKRKLKAWGIVLLALGSPIWLSLGIAAVAVIFSLYVSLWAVIISLWAVFASLIGSAVGCVVGGVLFTFGSNLLTGVAVIGAGIVCAGLSIFMFYGCKAATGGTLVLTKKMAIFIKNCFLRKEEA